jgi:hypothetical protein
LVFRSDKRIRGRVAGGGGDGGGDGWRQTIPSDGDAADGRGHVVLLVGCRVELSLLVAAGRRRRSRDVWEEMDRGSWGRWASGTETPISSVWPKLRLGGWVRHM